MLHIVYKDLYQARKTIAIYFLVGLFFIASISLNDMGKGMSAGFVFLMVYGVVIRNEYSEDKNKGYTLLRTLPIKPYKIVMSKYITVFLLATAGILYFLIIAKLSGGRIVIDDFLMGSILGGAGFTLISTGILYIFIFRYGATKAINISRLFFFGLFFLPVLISSLIEYVPKPSFIESGELEMLLANFNDWNQVVIVLGLASLAIYLLTMLLSISQFKKNKVM